MKPGIMPKPTEVRELANLTRSQFAIHAQEATPMALRCMRQVLWLALLQRKHDDGRGDDFVTVGDLMELDAVVIAAGMVRE